MCNGNQPFKPTGLDQNLNGENWMWNYIESWTFSEIKYAQSNWIKFHNITFSFKFIGIQFQTNNSVSHHAIQIQFFNAIILLFQYKFKLHDSNSVF